MYVQKGIGANERKERKVGRKSRRAADVPSTHGEIAPDLSRSWSGPSRGYRTGPEFRIHHRTPYWIETIVDGGRSTTAQIRRGHAQFVWRTHWRAEIFALPFLRLTPQMLFGIEGSSGKTNFALC